jgi:Ca-activated chloride channel homolog
VRSWSPARHLTATGLLITSSIALLGGVQQSPAFRTSVEAVRVDALVTAGRRPVTGLSAADFELHDNGVAQVVQSVETSALPIHLLLAIDVSGSVSGEGLSEIESALAAVLGQCGPEDRVSLLRFSHRIDLTERSAAPGGMVHGQIPVLAASGATAIYDTVLAATLLRGTASVRSALIILTDGRDTASWIAPKAVLRAVQMSDILVHAVVVGQQSPPLNNDELRFIDERSDPPQLAAWLAHGRFLDAIARVSGGKVFVARERKSREDALLLALSDLRSRYMLSYVPSGVARTGWHRIEVSVKRRNFSVSARRGYYSDGE